MNKQGMGVRGQILIHKMRSTLCTLTPNPCNLSPNRSFAAGFTLVEIMVASALFAVVMTVTVSALLSLVDANRKAQALQSVVNNLNIALDGMVRNMRMGSVYHCGVSNSIRNGALDTVNDCNNGGGLVAFEPFEGDQNLLGDQWVYWFAVDSDGIGRIYRSTQGSVNSGFAITSPEVDIEDLKFYVIGSSQNDAIQPKIVITIKGVAGVDLRTKTRFNIQAMASQRVLDI